MRVKIEVKQKHIDAGKSGSTHDCPVSKAIQDKLRKKYYPIVYSCYTEIGREKPYNAWSTTYVAYDSFTNLRKVSDFIFKFDDSKKVKPFTFYANIEEKLLKPSVIKGAKKKCVPKSK